MIDIAVVGIFDALPKFQPAVVDQLLTANFALEGPLGQEM